MEYQTIRSWRSGRIISRQRRKDVLRSRFGAPHYTLHRADLLEVLSRKFRRRASRWPPAAPALNSATSQPSPGLRMAAKLKPIWSSVPTGFTALFAPASLAPKRRALPAACAGAASCPSSSCRRHHHFGRNRLVGAARSYRPLPRSARRTGHFVAHYDSNASTRRDPGRGNAIVRADRNLCRLEQGVAAADRMRRALFQMGAL